MNSDGSVNYTTLADLLEFHVRNKTDAIIACGTTGEAATLSEKEHCEVLAFVAEKINGRIPVIAGTGSNDTSTAVMLSKAAQQYGIDALLTVTPYYNKTSQAGLIKHFNVIADSVDLPIILYNVPSRTGVNLLPETAARLAEHENILGLKEAAGDISQFAELSRLCGGKLALYADNDDQVLPMLALGAQGVISAAANVVPGPMHEIVFRWSAGDMVRSREIQLSLLPLIRQLFADVNPIPVKAALSMLGLCREAVRLPLTPLDDIKKAALRKSMEEVMQEALT
jgi:4-hydroxy-tetrahydrodipicolinate synthase